METSGNEDTALSPRAICSVYLITYSQGDTTQFTGECFANVVVSYFEVRTTIKVLRWI